MLKIARVSLSAVKTFEKTVYTAMDYSAQFDKGISCFDELLRSLKERSDSLRVVVGKMKQVQIELESKKKEAESEIARLTARINKLEDQISDCKDELANTPSSISEMTDDGEVCETSNPEYSSLRNQICIIEEEIHRVKDERFPIQKKLEHVNALVGRIASHIDAIDGVVYSISEKQSSCIQLKDQLTEVKVINSRRGKCAIEKLIKIEEIISNYTKIKMKYENSDLSHLDLVSPATNISHNTRSSSISVNITVNKTIIQEQRPAGEIKADQLTAEEIEKHQVRFDQDGRICMYDNKTFGGKYNSYELRLGRTIHDDNLISGHYEGKRGESKYIPSGRTVDSVIVKDILRSYGVDGIEYRNAEPDFEVCSEAVVKIKEMSENRYDYWDDDVAKPGNFTQADIECAALWNIERRNGKTDWCGRDVHDYRKANGLTWHEKCDTETMVLVRAEINLFFKHSGGCAECRVRDAEEKGGGFDE